jgi:hypothetical protein
MIDAQQPHSPVFLFGTNRPAAGAAANPMIAALIPGVVSTWADNRETSCSFLCEPLAGFVMIGSGRNARHRKRRQSKRDTASKSEALDRDPTACR